MSRKDYVEVARIIRDRVEDAQAVGSLITQHALANLAESLADMFKSDNSNFDRSRFMDACGLGDN